MVPLLASILIVLTSASNSRVEPPSTFEQLREKAEPIESLSSFLEKYVGGCSDPVEKATCELNAKKWRSQYNGKLLFITLDNSASQMLRAGAYDSSSHEFRIDLTPFFDGGGLALTEGKPRSQNAQGQPLIPLLPIFVKLSPNALPMDMERLIRTQNIRIHLLFVPQNIWRLPSKNKKDRLEGVQSKFVAVRLTDSRSGEELALRLSKY